MPAILGFIEKIFKPAAELVDEVVTSKEEKMQLSNELFRMKQQLTMQMLDYEQKLMEKRASVIQGEVKGTWLQRSWRPILMLSFGFIIVYQYFIGPVFGLTQVNLPEGFWLLLELGVGGYVIGRSVEKITPSISDAIKTRKANAPVNYPPTQQNPYPLANYMPNPGMMQANTPQTSPNGTPASHGQPDEPETRISKREARRLARRRRGEARRRRRAQKVNN